MGRRSNQLIQVLLTKTGIKLFDEAIKMELSEAVYNIIEKHKIVEDENNDRKKRAS